MLVSNNLNIFLGHWNYCTLHLTTFFTYHFYFFFVKFLMLINPVPPLAWAKYFFKLSCYLCSVLFDISSFKDLARYSVYKLFNWCYENQRTRGICFVCFRATYGLHNRPTERTIRQTIKKCESQFLILVNIKPIFKIG